MLGTTRQHGLDSVRGNSQADQMNARLETAPSCPVTAGYKMEHCCSKASGGAGGWRALPGAHSNGTERNLLEFPSACCSKPARTEPVSKQKAEH